ncbi:MAG TPA: DUF305 domain-containing protein [Longimicrobiales bacterium]|nr:DUF305 domain-containing protein [Longimicrobiales bacterium]
MQKWQRSLAGASLGLFALAAVGACGARQGPDATSEARPEGPSSSELEALYRARTDSARLRYTEADVAFMSGMIAHHGQALVMVALAPERAASPQVETLAARIANSQRDEIATMQRWLRDRGEPVPAVHIEGTTLMVHGMEHAGHMPGMLTAVQLAALASARGEDFDRLFLRSMIQHHEGAVIMVRALFATDGAGQDEEVFRFASDVHVDQLTEIERMRLMLTALSENGGTPCPAATSTPGPNPSEDSVWLSQLHFAAVRAERRSAVPAPSSPPSGCSARPRALRPHRPRPLRRPPSACRPSRRAPIRASASGRDSSTPVRRRGTCACCRPRRRPRTSSA